MHPFLPNAIALVASFLNASKTDPGAPDEGRSDGVSSLLCALRHMGEFNDLARELRYKLEADVVQGTPTTMEVTRQWAT
jgi:hypothetical protein